MRESFRACGSKLPGGICLIVIGTEGDVDAAHRLVTSHLGLVVKIATGCAGYGLPLVDLVSEGNIGLMLAVKRFDPGRGVRLSTYAMWWIRAGI
jgi:RNA polymerase sigma-32 factor